MKRFVLIMIFIFALTGCTEEDEVVTLTLIENDESTEITKEKNATATLPDLVQGEDYYIYWSDGDTIYTDEIILTEDITLTATKEYFSDVFTTEVLDISDNIQTLIINEYSGNLETLIIPETIDDYQVTHIGSGFINDTEVIHLSLPVSIRNIPLFAFDEAHNLETLSYYGSDYGLYETESYPSPALYELLDSHDAECDYDESSIIRSYPDTCPVKEVFSKSEPVTGPDGKLYYSYHVILGLEYNNPQFRFTIDFDSFSGNHNLQKVELHPYLLEINARFFPEDKYFNIEFYKPHDSYEIIDNNVYSKSLDELVMVYNESTTLTLLDTIESFTPYAFYHGKHIEELVVSEEHPYLIEVDNVLLSKDKSTLFFYPPAKPDTSYQMDSAVETIDALAFANTKHLKSIEFNEGLLTINHRAFYQSGIETVALPDSLQRIETHAFEAMEDLTTITMPSDSLPAIPERLFPYSDSLTAIYVPEHLEADYKALFSMQSYLDLITVKD